MGTWKRVEHLPLRDDGDKRSLLLMLDRQVRVLSSGPNRTYRLGDTQVDRERLLATARALRLVVLEYHGRPEFGLRIREKFNIYRTGNPAREDQALFTGYYDPELVVSAKPDARYRYPIYRKPDDLILRGDKAYRREGNHLAPYYTREQIDGRGALAGKGYEIAWADDYVSVFYLQVQGSGRLRFLDGRTQTLHFSAHNGYPFSSAAKPCMNAGLCPGGYQQNLAWFRANLAQAFKYFFMNQRFIFFRTDDQPPTGVQGIPLTPMRTIATDKRHYPPGAIAWVKVPMPSVDAQGNAGQKTVSLLVADGDTGSAIKGTGRADFYYGSGTAAEKLAGRTYGWGEMYYLLVK